MPRTLRRSEITIRLQRALNDLEHLNPERLIDALRDFAAGVSSSGGGAGATNAISDPTGNGALAVDEWAMMRQEVSDLVRRISLDAHRLVIIQRVALEPPVATARANVGLAKCANIHGCDNWASKAGRCETCYRFNREHGHDRRQSGQPTGERKSGDNA